MKNKDNFTAHATLKFVCMVLIIYVCQLWCGTRVFAQEKPQEKQSFTTTENVSAFGVGSKQITTETKQENGDVTVETRLLDPKGKLRSLILTTTKSTGWSTEEREAYDTNEQLTYKGWSEKNLSGKFTKWQSEYYKDGVLDSGSISEMDETGKLKTLKEYDRDTQRYEAKPVNERMFPKGLEETVDDWLKEDKQRGGNKDFTKPVPAPKLSGAIDPCLIGTWECTSFKEQGKYFTGGGTGFRVTFSKDGTEAVDYSSMQPTKAGPIDTVAYAGTAAAKISTDKGVAKIEGMQKAGVTMTINAAGRRFSDKIPGLGAGGLGSTKDNNKYTCTGDSLEYQTSVARDQHANTTVKLTRVKP